MILANVEIFRALDNGSLVIEPQPQPRESSAGVESPYDTHSVDLRLGPEIIVPQAGPFSYDLTQAGGLAAMIDRNSRVHILSIEQPFRLEPNHFVLGRTLERVGLPIPNDRRRKSCLAARIEGKSSRARVGLLVHFTAPTVHPGFEGTLTLEMINLGPVAVTLVPGMAIAQLIIEEVKGLPISNPSQFQGQATPAGTGREESPRSAARLSDGIP
jgi:dCTP deaminase